MDAGLLSLSSLDPSAAPFQPRCLYRPPPPPPPQDGGCFWLPPPQIGAVLASGCCCGCVHVVPVTLPHVGWTACPPSPPPVMPVTVSCCPAPPVPMVVYFCGTPSPPSAAPTARCSITEIVEGAASDEGSKAEAGDEPTRRSVRTARRKAAVPLRKAFRASLRLPPPPPPPPPCAFGFRANTTSLMIRNIPNKFLKARLMAILDQHCAEENGELVSPSRGGSEDVRSEYDFLYVPIDFRTRFNKGYAFVNMTTATAARRLRAFLQDHRWDAAMSGKVCDVMTAAIQGRDALVAHFSASCFPCRTKEFLPVWFDPPRDGEQQTKAHVVGRLVVRPR